MSCKVNASCSIQNFVSMSDTERKTIYREANENNNIVLVRELNTLGMKPDIPSFSGPTIVSNYMDISTKHEVILNYLKQLHQSNRLMTETQFQSLLDRQWIKKTNFSRIFGADHLQKKIHEIQLKHIKVPLKVAVFRAVDALQFSGYDYCEDNFYEIYSEQIEIYAERIQTVNRKFSRDEIDELFKIIETSNFNDLGGNVIVAKDGVYIIDTEYKSFCGAINWGKMGSFTSFVSDEDMAYFTELVKKKISNKSTNTKDYSYFQLEAGPKGLQEEEIKNRILKLQYVGLEQRGCIWHTPNMFSFDLADIYKPSMQ